MVCLGDTNNEEGRMGWGKEKIRRKSGKKCALVLVVPFQL